MSNPGGRRVLAPLALDAVQPERGHVVRDFAGLTMGTSWSVRAVMAPERPEAPVRACIQAMLDDVIDQMSTWEATSALSRYNHAAPGSWVTLPDQCLYVLRYALAVAEASDGAYDPTSGPLVNLWGFGPDGRREAPPSPAAIEAARRFVGFQRVAVEPDRQRVYQPGGIYLDFSAIAKGHSVDLIAGALRREGISHSLVEVGGELRGSGVKPDGLPWWVQLESPPDAAGAAPVETVIALHGLSVATSGDYRKFFAADARRYSHTIDPATAQPIDHGLAAVSVVHPDCIAADVLSTALNVMGLARGLPFAVERGIAARFLQRRGAGCEETLSPALAALAQ